MSKSMPSVINWVNLYLEKRLPPNVNKEEIIATHDMLEQLYTREMSYHRSRFNEGQSKIMKRQKGNLL